MARSSAQRRAAKRKKEKSLREELAKMRRNLAEEKNASTPTLTPQEPSLSQPEPNPVPTVTPNAVNDSINDIPEPSKGNSNQPSRGNSPVTSVAPKKTPKKEQKSSNSSSKLKEGNLLDPNDPFLPRSKKGGKKKRDPLVKTANSPDDSRDGSSSKSSKTNSRRRSKSKIFGTTVTAGLTKLDDILEITQSTVGKTRKTRSKKSFKVGQNKVKSSEQIQIEPIYIGNLLNMAKLPSSVRRSVIRTVEQSKYITISTSSQPMTSGGIDMIHSKNRKPTVEQLEKPIPIVITKGKVQWIPKDNEHNSFVGNNFAEEIQDAAKTDSEAEIEEQSRSFNSNVHIYNMIVESVSNEFDSKDDCTGMIGDDQITPEQGGLSNLEKSTDSACSQQE